MASSTQTGTRRRTATEALSVDERLRQAFPEIDFNKIIDRGAFNQHNLAEKWDATTRQIQWWLDLSNGLN